jgi:hypothetical protein
MENNQQHKIDKIFKNSLENQQIVPPVDAWMGIQTYTIGQEESKKKVWLRYASLAMLFLLVSGFVFWYIVDNQKHTFVLITQKVVNKDTDHGGRLYVRKQTTALENAVRVLNPDSVKTVSRIVRVPNYASENKIKRLRPDLHSHEEFVSIPKTHKEPLIVEIVEDSLRDDYIEFAEPVNSFKDNKIDIIESKPLITNDLSEKLQKNSEGKIIALGVDVVDKKDVFKVDSVVYGNKFSLKHPIIDVSLLSSYSSSWFTTGDIPKNLINSDGDYKRSYFRFGISWKINRKIRTGFSFTFLNNTYDLPNNNGLSQGGVFTLETDKNGNAYYDAKTIYGNIKLPISEIKFADPNKNPQNGVSSPFIFEAKPPIGFPNKEFYSNVSMYAKSYQVGINLEYDLFSKQWIPKKNNGYQIYLKGEVNLQFIRKNGYFTSFGLIRSNSEEKYYAYYKDLEFLENKTETIFAGRVGLGARWLIGRRIDFYAEGYAQRSLNSWVEGLSFNTYQKTIGYQFGFHFNL